MKTIIAEDVVQDAITKTEITLTLYEDGTKVVLEATTKRTKQKLFLMYNTTAGRGLINLGKVSEILSCQKYTTRQRQKRLIEIIKN